MTTRDFNELADWWESSVKCSGRRQCFNFDRASSYFMRSSKFVHSYKYICICVRTFICKYIDMYIYIYAYKHTYWRDTSNVATAIVCLAISCAAVCLYIYIHTSAYTHLCLYMYRYIPRMLQFNFDRESGYFMRSSNFMHLYTYICICVHTFICKYVDMYIYICIYTYIRERYLECCNLNRES